MKFFETFIAIMYWLQIFLSPFLICGLISFFVLKEVSAPALIPGAILGIVLAEYIRRKIGLGVFFSRLYGSYKRDKK